MAAEAGEYRDLRIPHTRGDEPYYLLGAEKYQRVFPTHVGMNRKTRPLQTRLA